MNRKKSGLYNFNHVSSKLSGTDIKSLFMKELYAHYHRLSVCYGWAYKKSKTLNICLKMTSTVLTVTGAARKGVSSKVEKYRMTHTSYLKVLDDLRSYLRGNSYDHIV